MRKLKVLIISAVSVAIILVVCLTVVDVSSSLADRRNVRTFNDADLIPVRVEVAVESNAFWTLLKATNELYWPDRFRDRLDDLSSNTNWDSSLAADVLAKNRGSLSLFDQAMQQPYFLVPEPTNFADDYPYLGGWKAISHMASIRTIALLRGNNEKEAIDSAFTVIKFGQRAENSGGPILHYLVGAGIKAIGLRCVRQMVAQTSLPETNLIQLIDVLNGFKANREGLTNALKVEYQMECNSVDNFAAGKFSTDDSATDQTVISFTPKIVFNPTKTKMEFAQADRVLRDNISKPFSEIPWSELPAVKTNISVWQRLISGNAIGDILFAMMEPSLEAFASRASRENVEVTATQLLLALKIYKMRHGQLPESLSELVPELFPEVPRDAFDGKPFRYLPYKKLIYSVGPDLKDSGGEIRRNYSDEYDLPFRIEF